MSKSIKRNYLYNILNNISRVMFPLITAPYVSRVLEPDGVGLFNFANTYANWFALFAALGIPYYGIREIAKIRDDVSEQRKFVSEIISISVIMTLISSLIFVLSVFLIPQLNENYLIFLIAAIILYSTPFKIDWFFSGKEEFGYITLRSLVIKSLSVILLFIFVRDKGDLIIYVALNAGSLVLNELWNFYKLFKLGIRPYFTLSGRKHMKALLILFSSSIAISIYTILDTLMLGFLTDYDQVGFYNCATHITRSFTPIVTSLAAVALPRMAIMKEKNNWAEVNNLINKSASIVGYLSIPIALGIAVVSADFVPLFFGSQFYGTILPLQILVAIIIIVGFNNLTGVQILLGLGYDKKFLYSILAGTFANFFLNLILIPMYGAAGAAFSSVVAETIVLSVMLFYIYKYTVVRFTIGKELFFNVVVAASFFLISYFCKLNFNGWLYIFIVTILSSLIYISTQQIFGNKSQKTIIGIISRKTNKNL